MAKEEEKKRLTLNEDSDSFKALDEKHKIGVRELYSLTLNFLNGNKTSTSSTAASSSSTALMKNPTRAESLTTTTILAEENLKSINHIVDYYNVVPTEKLTIQELQDRVLVGEIADGTLKQAGQHIENYKWLVMVSTREAFEAQMKRHLIDNPNVKKKTMFKKVCKDLKDKLKEDNPNWDDAQLKKSWDAIMKRYNRAYGLRRFMNILKMSNERIESCGFVSNFYKQNQMVKDELLKQLDNAFGNPTIEPFTSFITVSDTMPSTSASSIIPLAPPRASTSAAFSIPVAPPRASTSASSITTSTAARDTFSFTSFNDNASDDILEQLFEELEPIQNDEPELDNDSRAILSNIEDNEESYFEPVIIRQENVNNEELLEKLTNEAGLKSWFETKYSENVESHDFKQDLELLSQVYHLVLKKEHEFNNGKDPKQSRYKKALLSIYKEIFEKGKHNICNCKY